MIRGSAHKYLYACLVLLALLGMAARAIIPAGFMPDFSVQAGTPFVICSGTGEKTIYVDDEGRPLGESGHKAEQPCVFALSFYAVSPFLPSVLVDPVIISIAFNNPHAVQPEQSANFLYPIRGPPVFSI